MYHAWKLKKYVQSCGLEILKDTDLGEGRIILDI
jgi:hypothetical protein